MGWIRDLVRPKARRWEDGYRRLWQERMGVSDADAEGVSGLVTVRGGRVSWQADGRLTALGPKTGPTSNPAQPAVARAQVRGALLSSWRRLRSEGNDPLQAWRRLQDDPRARRRYQAARGKGGLQPVALAEALEITAAATLVTAQRYGLDRVTGLSPGPAAGLASQIAGERLLHLLGATCLSSAGWNDTLTAAPAQIWGEASRTSELATLADARLVVIVEPSDGPVDPSVAHLLHQARHEGARVVVVGPLFTATARQADAWIATRPGQEGAFFMAVGHVLLADLLGAADVDSQDCDPVVDHLRHLTDAPMLVTLQPSSRGWRAGRLLRANQLPGRQDLDQGGWKFAVLDRQDRVRVPGGSVGHRWDDTPGHWNLRPVEPETGAPIDALLSLRARAHEVKRVEMPEFDSGHVSLRGVPTRLLATADGAQVRVATVFDLLAARYGVHRDLEGEYPAGADDGDFGPTPAWQERHTGVDRQTVLDLAREWGRTARASGGRCALLLGGGVHGRYHDDLNARAALTPLLLTGCVGLSGGGLSRAEGPQRVAPLMAARALATARDWTDAPTREQGASTWLYVHSGAYRHEGALERHHPVPDRQSLARGHAMDLLVQAVLRGWQPFHPHFDRAPAAVLAQARAAGASDPQALSAFVAQGLCGRPGADEGPGLAVADPEDAACAPRVLLTWGGLARRGMPAGSEHLLQALLGTHGEALPPAEGLPPARRVRGRAPLSGKLDLVVDLAHTADAWALYADVLLAVRVPGGPELTGEPAHAFLRSWPAPEVGDPVEGEAPGSEHAVFAALARALSDLAAAHLPEGIEDLVRSPLRRGTVEEIGCDPASLGALDEPDAVCGALVPVHRDLRGLHARYLALGEQIVELTHDGLHYDLRGPWQALCQTSPVQVEGRDCASLAGPDALCEALLRLSPELDPTLVAQARAQLMARTGLALADVQGPADGQTVEAGGATAARRLTDPLGAAGATHARAQQPDAAAVAFARQRLDALPWRTLTGRQHLYLDHPLSLAFGEQLPCHKPPAPPRAWGDLDVSAGAGLSLRCLLPPASQPGCAPQHDALARPRGVEPVWMHPDDAAHALVADGDWVELHNDHGAVCTRAVLSHRVPQGYCLVRRPLDRTRAAPRAPSRGGRRSGGQGSLGRPRINPVQLAGGYGHLCFSPEQPGPGSADREAHVLLRRLPQAHGQERT